MNCASTAPDPLPLLLLPPQPATSTTATATAAKPPRTLLGEAFARLMAHFAEIHEEDQRFRWFEFVRLFFIREVDESRRNDHFPTPPDLHAPDRPVQPRWQPSGARIPAQPEHRRAAVFPGVGIGRATPALPHVLD